jgi:eukaryotic-like serine/threonine-protein kinase
MADTLYPVLTTRLGDRRDRGYLAWVAIANEVAHLPLDSAPVDASPHALEIHVAGIEEPLVLIAEPLGPPDAKGFPLRLRPLDDAQAQTLRQELFGADQDAAPDSAPQRLSKLTPPDAIVIQKQNDVRARITEGHALSLARATGPLTTMSRRAPGALKGRELGDGRYVLEDLIGGGASGEVYRALHTALKRKVAVKVLHTRFQNDRAYCARFYQEALAASRLDHRNVLRVIDYGQEPDGLLYIMMELLVGRSLSQLLDEERRLPPDRVARLISQACAGLAHAHDAQLVHRDIKLENIVVVDRRDDDGNQMEVVKVCDFGIAHWTPIKDATDDDTDIVVLPDQSRVAGTPAYMAPEQIRGAPVDPRTDVYALGVVIYELATGHLPFPEGDAGEILRCHLKEWPKPPSASIPGFDPDLEAIILKALEKDPSKRFPNARAMRAALRDLAQDDGALSGQFRRVSVRFLPKAADFLTNTAEALTRLGATDPTARQAGIDAIGEAIRAAMVAGNVRAARDLMLWLERWITDPTTSHEERERAERAVMVMRESATARSLAEHLLGDKVERVDDAFKLLATAGAAAFHALLDVRRARTPTLELRARFVACGRAIGKTALPAIVEALEGLGRLASKQEEMLAEDLLRLVPDVLSDPAGEVVMSFVRLENPQVGAEALRALTRLWGVRAHPLLVGVLDTESPILRAAAVEGMTRLRTVDAMAIERLARITAEEDASEELRVAAASALATTGGQLSGRAFAFVAAQLDAKPSLIGSLRRALGGQVTNPHVVLALARALVALDRAAAKPVLQNLAAARGDVRPAIEALLAGR